MNLRDRWIIKTFTKYILPGVMVATATISAGVGVALVVSSTGCAIKSTTVTHPGAINAADSTIYDGLLVIQAAIEDAKTRVDKFPALKGPLNAQIIPSYNAAMASYKAYHTSLVAGTPPNTNTETSIQVQLAAITAALASALKSAGVN